MSGDHTQIENKVSNGHSNTTLGLQPKEKEEQGEP